MANIRKSFNLRNGVQVDDDNFIVNPNGLVGIGTSIPREFLDVHGTAKFTGLVTATNLAVTGVSNFYNDVKVGSAITLNASTGIISATRFVGDATGLRNIYAIAVDGWYVNVGNISTTSKVGIGTTLPYHSLQVGQNPLTGNGFSVDAITGNVYTTGIITSPSFSGVLNGNVNGDIYSTGISTFTTLKVGTGVTITDGVVDSNSFVGNIAGNIYSTGISTFTTLKVGTGVTISGGIVTATTFSGSLTGNVNGNVTGIASTALSLPSTARISITSVNSGFTSTGIATVTDTLYVTGFPAKIGVGTVSAPESDIEVNKSGDTSIRVISGNGIASIGIGRSAEVRTGNTNTFYSYSTRNSLDIINSNTGNVNYYLDYGSAGVGTGGFHWICGQNPSSPLMSLTYGGRLGLGITDPPSKLYVVGTSYITGITTIDNHLRVNNDLYVTGAGTSISGNAIYANSFNKIGGTSNQFLKANGSVDNSTYLTTTGNGSFLTGIVTSLVAGRGIAINSSAGLSTISIDGSSGIVTSITAGDGISIISSTGNVIISSDRPVLDEAQNVSGLGTSVDFTDIPSWVKRITVMFDGVSRDGASVILVRIGDSGGIETNDYVSYSVSTAITGVGGAGNTTGFLVNSTSASHTLHGAMYISLLSENTWVSTHAIANPIATSGANGFTGSGSKTLSGTLDRIRVTTEGGVNTFDNGFINIMYE